MDEFDEYYGDDGDGGYGDEGGYAEEEVDASVPVTPRPVVAGGRGLQCPNCGGRDIENDMASGNSICLACHVVVEENQIAIAVEFVEGAGGMAQKSGQFVPQGSSKAFTQRRGGGGGGGGGGAGGYNIWRDPRETTLANGRRRIQEVASRMRLGGHYIDAAHRLFTIAVEKNFVQGRRTTHVVASCLYIVCRQEKSMHMLIDFSDALQVNVYTLGTCFLKFRRLLGLTLEIIDPALYVYRFAAHLDLDERANAVSMTALRLVARMKRDWIVSGRRPAGICAAALLVAARAHGFSKHHQDVTRILRVCGMTVTNRVKEFELTPSANLTLDQFHAEDLAPEADPPSYSRNKIMEARVKAIQDGNTELLTSGALDDPLEGNRKSKLYRTTEVKETERVMKLRQLYSELEQELKASTEALTEESTKEAPLENDETDSKPAAALTIKPESQTEAPKDVEYKALLGTKAAALDTSSVAIINSDPVAAAEELVEEDAMDTKPAALMKGKDLQEEEVAEQEVVEGKKTTPGKDNAVVAEERQIVVVSKKSVHFNVPPELEKAHPRDPRGRLLVLASFATEEEMQASEAPVEARLSLTEWKKTMPDTMENELDDIFRTEEEEMQKEAIFNKINKEYLEQQERKESLRRDQEAGIDHGDDDAAQMEGHSRYKNRGRKRKGKDAEENPDATTEEALRAAMASRKVSRKINYDALGSLFDADGSLGNVTDNGGSTVGGEDEMVEI